MQQEPPAESGGITGPARCSAQVEDSSASSLLALQNLFSSKEILNPTPIRETGAHTLASRQDRSLASFFPPVAQPVAQPFPGRVISQLTPNGAFQHRQEAAAVPSFGVGMASVSGIVGPPMNTTPTESCALSRWIEAQGPVVTDSGITEQSPPLLVEGNGMFLDARKNALSAIPLPPHEKPQEDIEPLPIASSSWNMTSLGSGEQPFNRLTRQATANGAVCAAAAPPIHSDISQTQVHPKGAKANTKSNSSRFRRDQAEQWSDRFDELVLFVQQHGHCRVPRNSKKFSSLASWVKRQRYQYKLRQEGKTSFLTEERIAVLNQLGFVWDSHGSVWETRYKELEAFYREFGHSNVPYNHPNARLASWVKAQRREYKDVKEGKSISPIMLDRFLQLERLEFSWQLRNSGRKKSKAPIVDARCS